LPEELRVITRPIAAKDYWANTPVKRWITTEVFHAVYVDRGQAAAPPPPSPPPRSPNGSSHPWSRSAPSSCRWCHPTKPNLNPRPSRTRGRTARKRAGQQLTR
jgi:hypothetical protein